MPPAPAGLFQLRLKARPIGVQLGVFVGQRPQLIEHICDVPCHTDLIGLDVVSIGARFLRFVARGIALLNQPLLNPFQLGGMVSAIPLPFLARLRELNFQRLDVIPK